MACRCCRAACHADRCVAAVRGDCRGEWCACCTIRHGPWTRSGDGMPAPCTKPALAEFPVQTFMWACIRMASCVAAFPTTGNSCGRHGGVLRLRRQASWKRVTMSHAACRTRCRHRSFFAHPAYVRRAALHGRSLCHVGQGWAAGTATAWIHELRRAENSLRPTCRSPVGDRASRGDACCAGVQWRVVAWNMSTTSLRSADWLLLRV